MKNPDREEKKTKCVPPAEQTNSKSKNSKLNDADETQSMEGCTAPAAAADSERLTESFNRPGCLYEELTAADLEEVTIAFRIRRKFAERLNDFLFEMNKQHVSVEHRGKIDLSEYIKWCMSRIVLDNFVNDTTEYAEEVFHFMANWTLEDYDIEAKMQEITKRRIDRRRKDNEENRQKDRNNNDHLDNNNDGDRRGLSG